MSLEIVRVYCGEELELVKVEDGDDHSFDCEVSIGKDKDGATFLSATVKGDDIDVISLGADKVIIRYRTPK